MKYEINARPAYSFGEFDVAPGESVVAESGAMAWMSANVSMSTAARGGGLSALKRKLLGGESFFQNTFTVPAGAPGSSRGTGGKLALAPRTAGDIKAHELDGEELVLEKSSFLASGPGVSLDSQWQGLRGLLNEGLFVMKASGRGTLFFDAWGLIEELDVDGEIIVDNGYAVAWEPTLSWRLTRARKIRSFLFSDQLLLRFSGRGKLWVQSRSPQGFANWVHPFRPRKKRD